MDIRDRRALKAAAEDAISAASYDPRKLILIHMGASVALSLLLALVDYLLEQQIGGTGGLSGVGSRAILETVQTVLMVGQLVAASFWQIGYVYVALRISRRQNVGPGSLLEGFRRFGPVLRLGLTETLLYSGLGMLCVYAAFTIFGMTPWAEPMMQAYESGSEEALLAAIDACIVPLMGVVAVVMLVVMAPYAYRLRMAQYVLMDHPGAGAMASIRMSRLMMYRNRINLFKVDLSFWWFYALEMLVTMIAYGDVLLPMFGVELPWSATVSYYVFLVLCYVGQLALYWWRGNTLQVTYAMCYDALLPKKENTEE